MGEGTKSEVFALMEAVASVKTEVATVKVDVNQLKDNVNSLSNGVDDIKTTVDGVKNDIRALKIDVTSMKDDIDEISDKTISELKSLVGDLTSKIKILSDVVERTSRSTSMIHKSLFEESPTHSSIMSSIKNTKEGLEEVKTKVANIEGQKRAINRQIPSDSGSHATYKESKKTVITVIVTIVTTAVVGFLGNAIWDSIVDNISRSAAIRQPARYDVRPDTTSN